MATFAAPADAGPAEPEEREERRKRLVLIACCLAQFMVILDLSIVNVALPTIQSALKISASDLQWVIDAYAIMFAGFLMLAGRATDLFGQRRLFGWALFAFSVASFVGGIAPTSGVLIGARAGQGLAGAGMASASLAIITSTFAPGPERHRAIALWGAMNGAGGAVGTLAGGVLTDAFSWRWVLLINVPMGIFGAAVAARAVIERRSERKRGFDLPGALLLTSGLLISTYGGVTAGSDGFGSASALVPIGIGSALLTLFPLVERRVKDPLVPPGAVTAQLRKINVIVLLFSSAIFSMWFASSLYLQQVLSLTPLQAGLCFLPMALGIFAAARPAGKLTTQAGVRPVLGGGLSMLALGLLLMSRVGSGGSAIQYIVLPGILVAFGIGFSVVSSTIAATQSAAPDQAGLTSSLVNTARQVGGGLGLAVLISIATQHTSGLIGDGKGVDQSLTDGFSLAYAISAALVGVAALLAFLTLPGPQEAAGRALGRKVLTGVAAVTVVFLAAGFGIPRSHDQPLGRYVTKSTWAFATRPDLHPPKLQVQLPADKPLPGFIMMANFLDLTKAPIVGQSGPMMLDSDLDPVWFKPVPQDVLAGNLDTHVLDGKPVLAWWQGDISETGEINSGEIEIVDQHYRKVASLEGKDGWVLSLHDLVIRGHTAWVTANRNVTRDLSDVGGVSHGVLVDSALQAYDLKTGKLLYTWDAAEHIPLSQSQTQPPSNGFPWDAFHINSLQLTPGGRALVSMRNTWAGYYFDIRSGKLIWTLGGKGSSFRLAAADRFSWQHDMELRSPTSVSLFDDHCCEITGAGVYLPASRSSRGLTLSLDSATKTAKAAGEVNHGDTFRSQYMGNVQSLAGGKTFVGWGQVPFVSEYSASGKLIFDGALPSPDLSYRARLRRWVGLPLDRPAVAATRAGGRTSVAVSWNGATEVRRWRVVGTGVTKAKRGFETALSVPGSPARVTVQALGAGGKVLGTSAAVSPKG